MRNVLSLAALLALAACSSSASGGGQKESEYEIHYSLPFWARAWNSGATNAGTEDLTRQAVDLCGGYFDVISSHVEDGDVTWDIRCSR